MSEFFEGMSGLEQTYWIVALIGSGVFAIIFIMTFLGGGDVDMEADMTDLDVDDGGVGFQFFTFKNVVAFFTIFGWTGVVCFDANMGTGATVAISSIAGLIMMFITSAMFFYMSKLTQSGTLRMEKAVGAVGEVYLPIGPSRSTVGKVMIKVQGSLRELDAISDAEDEIATSTMVRVLEIVSAELLLVERLSK